MPKSKRNRRHTTPSGVVQEGRVGPRRNKRDEQWNASNERWNVRFNELVQYKAKHGDCNVPQRQGKLGNWVRRQRQAYMANSLAQDHINQLNSIGFKWAMKESVPTVPWETRFNELFQYKTKHGDCNVPSSQGKLGTWVRAQRKAYKANSLAQDRIDQLNGIGFNWAMRATKGGAGPKVPRKTVVAGASIKIGDCASEPVLSPVPSNNSGHNNNGSESDDDGDELGALIYEQMMSQKREQMRTAH